MSSRIGAQQPVEKRDRFAFGKNWQRFLRHFDAERLRDAEWSIKDVLRTETLTGKRFLDVGSGSGLFSLAARRLGAKVRSFDYDADSVSCTSELKQRYYPEDPDWVVEQGSALDRDYIRSLGSYDVVYAWGVLHHTGAMWNALDNIIPVIGPGGMLVVAIYNDQGWLSDYWKTVKKLYNANFLGRLSMVIAHAPYLLGVRVLARSLRGFPRPARGMSLWYDMIDWLGGHPFETAKPEQVTDFCQRRGFAVRAVKTCGNRHGCNEFVFLKKS